MSCKGCTAEKPCFGCEHDRRAKVSDDKIQEIIGNLKIEVDILWDDGQDASCLEGLVTALEQELSKPTENKDTEMLDWIDKRFVIIICGVAKDGTYGDDADNIRGLINKAMKEGTQ